MKQEKSNKINVLELPPPQTARWVKSRKMAVVKAIESGVLSDDTACQRYGLSPEELASWKTLVQKYGPDALRSTHLRQYRHEALLLPPGQS